MLLTVMYEEKLFNMEVTDDMEIMNFKAFCSVEANLPESVVDVKLLCNGQLLEDGSKTLKDYSVIDGDVVIMETLGGSTRPPASTRPSSGSGSKSKSSNSRGRGNIDFSAIQIPGMGGPSSAATSSGQNRTSPGGFPDDPRAIYEMLRNSPHERAIIREHNPPLSAALESADLAKFTEVLTQQRKEKADKEMERLRMMSADPFDAEVQRKIAEEIRLKNVDSNMETAMEYSPESFGQVVMLYIDCRVNGHEVKAFVDSGAQMTIMSRACAERCGIMRLVDVRWAGIAKGVGVQKIIGRVHLGQIMIEDVHLQSSFSILEEQPMDMLLGLDMLKRHQCVIDLKNNELLIGTTATRTRFLPEAELPEHARLNRNPSASESDDALLAEAMSKSAQEAAKSSGPRSSQTEKKVRQLMEKGFSRPKAEEELTKSGGDVEKALTALMARKSSALSGGDVERR